MDANKKMNNNKYANELKKIEAQIERQELNTREKLEEAYDTIDKNMKESIIDNGNFILTITRIKPEPNQNSKSPSLIPKTKRKIVA